MHREVRDITSSELTLFGEIVARLERFDQESELRELVFPDVVKLMRADFAASYVWNTRAGRFDCGVIHNMDPENISRYEQWYQFRDPHTFQLRAKRRATLIEEVTPYDELQKTEFYNDFLKRDGLHHGINLFLFDGERDLGDFRLWRAKSSPDFNEREVALLDTLAPFLRRAFLRATSQYNDLTFREKQVCALVAKGCRDRDIGDVLGISFATVRTHINKAMEKRGCANRAELAVAVSRL